MNPHIDMRRTLRTVRTAAMLLSVSFAMHAAEPPAPAEPARGWPLFRGDPQLTGVVDGTLGDELSVRWVYEAGEGFDSTATVYVGMVYVGSLDGMLHAVDLATGKPKWTYQAGIEIKASPFLPCLVPPNPG